MSEGMRNTWIIIVSLVLVNVLMVSIGVFYSEAATECWTPSSAVSITVKQEADKAVYEFNVINKHDVPIYVITIGVSEKPVPWNKDIDAAPKEVGSPEGWIGKYIYLGDDAEAFYVWSMKREKGKDSFIGGGIAPGESLSGFKLVMNKPLDILKTLPFKARFLAFGQLLGCVNGTVVSKE
jgi:hypothetical protein